MGRPKKTASNGAPPTIALALPDNTMYREDAFKRARELAVEEYQARKSQQQIDQQHFVAEHGRIDRIDRSYAEDIRRLLARTLAIAKNKAGNDHAAGQKVAKLATMLSEMLATIEYNLANDVVQELFDRVDEREYLQRGYTPRGAGDDPEEWVGPRATKAQEFLAGITVVDKPETLTKTKLAKADLEMEKKAAQGVPSDADRMAEFNRNELLRRQVEADERTMTQESCEHRTRFALEDEERFENLDIIFTHKCGVCDADVANYDGKWRTERAIEALIEERENEAAYLADRQSPDHPQ